MVSMSGAINFINAPSFIYVYVITYMYILIIKEKTTINKRSINNLISSTHAHNNNKKKIIIIKNNYKIEQNKTKIICNKPYLK